MQNVGQFVSTVSDIMTLMAPSAGGAIPAVDSEEYAQWLSFIQIKYEEASKRGFWRRLLTKDVLPLTAGDTEAYLPVRFQRPNSLYIAYVDGVDVADPDRIPDGQSIFIEMDNDAFEEDGTTPNTNFGRWRITFTTEIAEDQDAPIWYFATPQKPVAADDKVILPGDMIAFGALSEVFRTTSLPGSQDDARIEYENRLSTYMNMETIPARHELLSFQTNPRRLDRTALARKQYTVRPERVGRRL